ncbi:MAG: BON domain-containing protein [Pirellulaceae bacterium]|nr:BON domain-containing protein [Pirellulaceae bacterium]
MIRSGRLFYVALVFATLCGLGTPLLAQQSGGTGGVPTVDPGTTQTTQAPATTAPGTQGSFETGGDFDFGNLVDQLQIPEIPEIENTRNQPFVGRSIERFETLGIQAHPRSNATAPGSVFSSGGGAGGRGFAGARGGNAGQRGLQNGTGNSVVRRSLRTRLVPRITVKNPVTPEQVSSRFQQRLASSQMASNPMANVQVRVENKTAYLSGVVSTIDARNRAERMARLEPGIYRIENQIEVQP